MRHIPFRLATGLLAVMLLSACAGAGSTDPDDDGQTGSFSVAIGNQGRATVVIGGTTTVPISVSRAGGYSGTITVTATGLPSGVTAAPLNLSNSQGSGSLVLTAASNASRTPVAASVAVTGTGGGVTSGTVYLTLSVTMP